MRAGFVIGSLFWVSLFVFHAQGNSWPLSVFLSFSGLVAGLLAAFAVTEFIARHKKG